jgi:hypothetical protein
MKDVEVSSHEGFSSSDFELTGYRNRNDLDNQELSQLGKKPVLKVWNLRSWTEGLV